MSYYQNQNQNTWTVHFSGYSFLACLVKLCVLTNNSLTIPALYFSWNVSQKVYFELSNYLIYYHVYFRTHMQDLQEVTQEIHYENYRSEKLSGTTGNRKISARWVPLNQCIQLHVYKLFLKILQIFQILCLHTLILQIFLQYVWIGWLKKTFFLNSLSH